MDTLFINDGQGHYPKINGFEVNPGGDGDRNYSKINLLIPYTGNMRIGSDFKREYYVHMGFVKPSAYGIVWDLEFSDGKITQRKDISESVKEIEGQYHKEYQNEDIIKKIHDSFERDLLVR